MVPQSSQKEDLVYWHNTERYFSAKTLKLHFKGQQTYMSTSFAIAGKESLVTTLLYYKLSFTSYPRKVNFALVT